MTKKKKKKEKEPWERYVLSPKGCAVCAMLDAGIIDNINDERIDVFYHEYERLMSLHGYIKKDG